MAPAPSASTLERPATAEPKANKSEAPFIVRGITAGVSGPAATSEAAGGLMISPKAKFVAPTITPALPTTVPPSMSLVVPRDDERQSDEAQVQPSLRIGAAPAREDSADSADEPTVVVRPQIRTPVRPQQPQGQQAPATDKFAPVPVEIAPAPSIVERRPAPQEPVAEQTVPLPPKATPLPATVEPTPANEEFAEQGAADDMEFTPEPPAVKPTPAQELLVDQPAPTPVETAPGSSLPEPTPAHEELVERPVPRPIETEPVPSVSEPTPAQEELVQQPAPTTVKITPFPVPAKTPPARESLADRPARVETGVAPAPVVEPPGATEEMPSEDQLAPAPVAVAPAPLARKPARTRESVAEAYPRHGSNVEENSVAAPIVKRRVDDRRIPAAVIGSRSAVPSPLPEPQRSHVKDSGEDPQYTKLPWNHPTKRSPQLVAALKRADGRVLHGYELASRGALYSARAEFIAAIKIVAQAHDAQEQTRRHTKAAAAGLAALKEARDFARYAKSLQDVDLSTIVLPHSTPVLKDGDASDMTATAAARLYYTYAQEQLAAAVAQEICGSMALYAMGKVETMAAKSDGATFETTGRATALYRASLIAYPKNFRAANELGVVLAENGQYELARDLLIRSVSVSPQATTWRNLASIYTRLGQRDAAENATRQAVVMKQQGRDTPSTPPVKWVDTKTFAATTPVTDSLPVAVPPPSQKPAASKNPPDNKSPKKSPIDVARKSIGDWFRRSSRR